METRTDLTEFTHKMDEIRQHISDIIVGQTKAVDMVLTSIIADGHVLLEGVPGVAKTLLARLVSRLIDARFSRIQFTPDLMPSDVLGTTVYNLCLQTSFLQTRSIALLQKHKQPCLRLWKNVKLPLTALLTRWAASTQ